MRSQTSTIAEDVGGGCAAPRRNRPLVTRIVLGDGGESESAADAVRLERLKRIGEGRQAERVAFGTGAGSGS
jgi:hypothetical protein